MLPIDAMLDILAEWLRVNPALALRWILTFKPIREYIVTTFTQEELNYLSDQVVTNPTGLIAHLNSPEGKSQIQSLLTAHRAKLAVPKLPQN